MKQFTGAPGKDSKPVFQFILFALAVVCVLLLMPRSPHFGYEYETGRPWAHNDLTAPVTFPIIKSEAEIQEERQELIRDFIPFYVYNTEVRQQVLSEFEREISARFDDDKKEALLAAGKGILQSIYENGIFEAATEHEHKEPDDKIRVMENRVVHTKETGNFLHLNEARNFIRERTQNDEIPENRTVRNIILDVVRPNIVYDEELSVSELQEKLDAIGKTRGIIQAGEVVIRHGEIVTEEKSRILFSLEREYSEKLQAGDSRYFILGGYILLITLLFLIYFLYLHQFHYEYLKSYRSLFMLLVNMVAFTGISAYIVSDDTFSIYLVPFCIVPIILIAFFGSRLAFITHLFIIMLVALMLDNRFEFLLVQFLAGFTATLSMLRVRYLSQFFAAVLLTFAAYALSFLGIDLIRSGNFTDLNYMTYLWLSGNFILTLLAYPLIYAHEKIFGFVSDITLLEMGDVNNKLLRELSTQAPGTFQHSLQVANLSETILNAIHGNALLARVAALYHDIGKMHQPEFFIENQRYISNPHDELDAEESCKIIINHVQKGVEMAEKYNLPQPVIDIIRTHHGTSRLEYFYRNEISKYSEAQVDEMKFRYPGPKPRTKEEAVIMMTDSAEAASRALKKPGSEEIDALVDKLIESKLQDKQLENAEITLKEISTIRELLKKLLKSLYHVRIEYPEEVSENNPK
jgi:cyclic-di-AMP phosphodiesterase PgpH